MSLLRDRFKAGSNRWTPAWPSPARASPSNAPELTLCPIRTFCWPGWAVARQRATSPNWLAWGRRRFRSGDRVSTFFGRPLNLATPPSLSRASGPLLSELLFSVSFHLPPRPTTPFNFCCRQALIGERFLWLFRGGKSDGAGRTSVHFDLPTWIHHVEQAGSMVVLFDTELNRSVFQLSFSCKLAALDCFSWP